jgi:hypothetical protein
LPLLERGNRCSLLVCIRLRPGEETERIPVADELRWSICSTGLLSSTWPAVARRTLPPVETIWLARIVPSALP